MTWQVYVDKYLMIQLDGRKMTSAAIIGHDGAVLAQSANFPKFKVKEIVGIMEAFEEGKLAKKGLRIGGTKYEVIQGEQRDLISGEKGDGGIVVKKTNQTLLVGIYNMPMTSMLCRAIVENVAPYLIEQGF
ncbi:profilin-like [Salvia divinorum]|uniref:Profilin n=1 Tax=Salvia divinorum TaxID=28513 RepID=A0ABD1H829_SALDI